MPDGPQNPEISQQAPVNPDKPSLTQQVQARQERRSWIARFFGFGKKGAESVSTESVPRVLPSQNTPEVPQAQPTTPEAQPVRELTPMEREMQQIMQRMEVSNQADGYIGLYPKFGEGKNAIFVLPASGETQAKGSDGQELVEWRTNQFLVVTPEGFKIIETERSDGGTKAYGEITKVLEGRKKQATNTGEYKPAENQGLQDRGTGYRLSGKGLIVLGAGNDSREGIVISHDNRYSINGDFPLKGARVFDVNNDLKNEISPELQKVMEDLKTPASQAA